LTPDKNKNIDDPIEEVQNIAKLSWNMFNIVETLGNGAFG
jgi:hypothetical protein